MSASRVLPKAHDAFMTDDRREFIAARVDQLFTRGLLDASETVELRMGILFYEKAYARLWRKYSIVTFVFAVWCFVDFVEWVSR